MKGHIEIIKARDEGKKPQFVFINDYPCKTDWFEWGEHATVCTHGDMLSSLDFRFLIDLDVSISALTEARAKAMFEKAKEAGANAVAACHVQGGIHPMDQTGWTGLWHKEVAHA